MTDPIVRWGVGAPVPTMPRLGAGRVVESALGDALEELRAALRAEADAQHAYEALSARMTEANTDLCNARHAAARADERVRALLRGPQ